MSLVGPGMRNWDLFKEVGENIRDARKKKGYTQEALVAEINISRPSLSNIERGTQCAMLDTIYEIADELGISPASLMPGCRQVGK